MEKKEESAVFAAVISRVKESTGEVVGVEVAGFVGFESVVAGLVVGGGLWEFFA